MTERASIPPDVQAAVERVLDETGRRALGNDFDTSELAELLDPASVKRSIIETVREQRRPALAKERRKHFEKAAKLAGELHALLNDERFPIWAHLTALDGGAGFPLSEGDDDPWNEMFPLASYFATRNGLARLENRFATFVRDHGDDPLIDPAGFSQTEMLIVGPVLSSFNTLTRRDRATSPQRSRDPETGAPGGPFVRYAVQVMKELGADVSAETIMAAIRKRNASGRNGGKSG